MKRPIDTLTATATATGITTTTHPSKRRMLKKHFVRHPQPDSSIYVNHIQDESTSQKQLIRSIALILSAIGYTDISAPAMEMFRSTVEDYMLHFLHQVKVSMLVNRRPLTPTPADFTMALKAFGLHSSDLSPYLSLPSIPSLTQPSLAFSPPLPSDYLTAGSRVDAILFPPQENDDSTKRMAKYIPKHLPVLPSAHTWRQTPVLSTKETDALKIRERATMEGVMAERALRRLMAAQSEIRARDSPVLKTTSLPPKIPDSNALSTGRGTKRTQRVRDPSVYAAALAAAAQVDEEIQKREEEEDAEVEEEEEEEEVDMGDLMQLDSQRVSHKREKRQRLDMNLEPGLAVNYDREHWRLDGRGRTGG